jgi:hydroxymethylglutaryl-CoA lyase
MEVDPQMRFNLFNDFGLITKNYAAMESLNGVDMNLQLPTKVDLQEVVLRDGIQRESKLIPTDRKLALIRQLIDCGIRYIEVSSFVNPRLVPQMADAEALWDRIERRKGIVYSALILNRSGLERAARCRVPHIGIYVSASETHSMKNCNQPVSEALKEALQLIEKAKKEGMQVRAGIMNAFGCAYEGEVSIEKVIGIAEQLAACDPDEIAFADSSGLADPVRIKKVLQRASESFEKIVSLHLHNTRGRGLANLLAGLEKGVTRFDTALGGLGGCPFIPGAKGNIATEDTVSMLNAMGIETGIDLNRLIQASLGFEEAVGNQPFPAMVTHLCREE